MIYTRNIIQLLRAVYNQQEYQQFIVKVQFRAYIKPFILLRTLIILRIYECRGTRLRSWLTHSAASRKVAVSIPDEVTGIFHY
jgi:hypothetical protein